MNLRLQPNGSVQAACRRANFCVGDRRVVWGVGRGNLAHCFRRGGKNKSDGGQKYFNSHTLGYYVTKRQDRVWNEESTPGKMSEKRKKR